MGVAVGETDGSAEGATLGTGVGARVGALVGLGVTHTPSKKMPGGGQLDNVQPETDVKPGAQMHVLPLMPVVKVGEQRKVHVVFCR